MTIARLLWLLPLLLVLITIGLLKAGFEQRETYNKGESMIAEVVELDINSRAEVTYGEITVKIPDASGAMVDRTLPGPISLLNAYVGKEEVAVRVLRGSAQEVLLEAVGRAQWRMSLIHSAMSGIGALLLIFAVGSWNRYLSREGDPAMRTLALEG